MPHADPEARRTYGREYARRSRAAETPEEREARLASARERTRRYHERQRAARAAAKETAPAAPEPRLCECGCGQAVKGANRFVQFHHLNPRRAPSASQLLALEEPMTSRCPCGWEVGPIPAREAMAAFAQHRERCPGAVAA